MDRHSRAPHSAVTINRRNRAYQPIHGTGGERRKPSSSALKAYWRHSELSQSHFPHNHLDRHPSRQVATMIVNPRSVRNEVPALREALIRPHGGLSALREALCLRESNIRWPGTAVFGQQYPRHQGINAPYNTDRYPQSADDVSHKRNRPRGRAFMLYTSVNIVYSSLYQYDMSR
jgi:hypothetical protein